MPKFKANNKDCRLWVAAYKYTTCFRLNLTRLKNYVVATNQSGCWIIRKEVVVAENAIATFLYQNLERK